MSIAIGRKFALGLARETSRGTTPVSASFYVRHTEIGIQDKLTMANQEFSLGIIEDSVGEDIVKQIIEGDIKMPVTDKAIGLVLYSTLGTLSTSANTPESGVHTHTISVLQSAQHPSMSLYLDDPASGQDYTYKNCMISALELNAEVGKYLELSYGIRGQKGVTASLTPAVTAENVFRPQDITFKQAVNLAGLSGASALPIRKFNLKIEKNLEDDDVLGSIAPVDFYNKQMVITGTIEAVYQNESDFKTNTLAGTARAIRLQALNAGVTIGASSNPKLTIDLAKCYFEEITVNRGANDIITQTLSFKGVYSTTDSSSMTAVLINTQASY